jgi:hypothetical protein
MILRSRRADDIWRRWTSSILGSSQEEWCMDSMTTYAACARIQTEYIEMPDLKLTVTQVRRLCGLPPDVCAAAVRFLVANGFLRQTPNGELLRRGRDATAASATRP